MNELLSRIAEELRYAWRFRWYAVLVAWILCVVGWLLVYSMPSVYQVEARVRIDTQSTIEPLLGSMTVEPNANRQIALLIHTALSRPNLEEIARRTGLDIQATTPEAEERLLDSLARGININSTGGGINMYRIAYTASDPETARAVVQQVINVMTGMAASANAIDSRNAMQFLSRKVEDYREQLNEIEKELADFKKAHPELMSMEGGFLARLRFMRVELEQMQNELTSLRSRRSALQEQLAELSSGSRIIPPGQTSRVQSLDARIAQKESQLQQLLTRYTSQHPDVIRLQGIISRLQEERQQAVAQYRANPQRAYSVNSPAYRQVSERLNELNIEIDTLRAAIERQTAQIEELAAGSDEATDAQAQLSQLTRNYEIIKQQYEELLNRLYTARLSDDVATIGDNLNFRIVDPPETPDIASGPPRMLYMLAVLLAGLGGGAVFALFLSQVRPVFMTRRKLTEATGLPVLGAVSMAWSIRQRLQRRTGLAMFAVALVGLFVCFIGAVALMPLGTRVVPSIL